MSLRAVIIGAVLSLLLGAAGAFVSIASGGLPITNNISTPGALFLLFGVVLLARPLAWRAAGRSLLRPAELLLIYCMLLVASVVPSRGLLCYLLTLMGSWLYYATPENNWAELIHPHVRRWLVVDDEVAVKQFYEGIGTGGRIPYEAWIPPLAHWLAFLAVLWFVMVCAIVILRKQWIEHERLAFPLTQLPLALAHDYVMRPDVPFFRSAWTWSGFAIPLVLGSVNALHDYYGVVPAVQLTPDVEVFRRALTLHFWFSFGTMGFAYFISSPVAFSIWFFKLLGITASGLASVVGWGSSERLDMYIDLGSSSPGQAHQSMGAMVVVVGSGLWVARDHLRAVCRRAFLGDPDVDDGGELLSYRTAVCGALVGVVLLTVWLHVAGLSLWTTVTFLAATFVLFLALTRAVCEAGIPVLRPAMSGSAFVISGFGASRVGDEGLVQLAFDHSWAVDLRITVMAVVAHVLRLMHGRREHIRLLGVALLLALVLGFIGGAATLLGMAYRHGAVNLEGYYFVSYAQAPFAWMASWMTSPAGPNWSGWAMTGLGMGVMGGLYSAWRTLSWWPLHPLGYALMGIGPMDYYWFSFFLGWLTKSVVLRYGGAQLYRRTLPLFLGLILGQFVCSGLWNIVDQATGLRSGWLFPLM
ncbi:MAG: DUF6785 family protein [Candidatus Latescibacterota bacterium]